MGICSSSTRACGAKALTFEALLLGFILMILLPVTGIVAGLLSWAAFRSPSPHWGVVGVAVAVLVTPYILTAIVAGGEGLALAISSPHPAALPSKLVAIGIVIATFRHRRGRTN